MTSRPPPTEPTEPTGPAAPAVRGALAALSLSLLLSALGNSVAPVGLPAFAQAFGASFQQVQWVLLAYLLAITALIVGAGRLGDLFGRKRLLVAGMATFTVASGLCALSPSLAWLIAARAVQGVGGAVMMALTMAFVADVVPRERIGRAMGLLGTMSAVGTAMGPSAGGLLLAAGGWPALFAVQLPFGALAVVLAARFLPPDAPPADRTRPTFDVAGTLLLALSLAAYALAMTVGSGRFGAANGALLLAAAGGLALFVWVEARATSPLIRLAMLRDPVLGPGLTNSVLVCTVTMATLVIGPFYLALALDFGPAQVGLALSVGPITAALAGVPSGRLVDRFGSPRAMAIGLAAMVAGCGALALLPRSLGAVGYLAPVAVVLGGYALFQAANNTAVMANAGPQGRGVVSALLNLSRNLGLITGASVMGAVFAAATGVPELARASPDALVHAVQVTFGVVTLLMLAALGIALVSTRRAAARNRPA